MAYCSKCGDKQNDRASFCTKCGTQLRAPNAIPTFTPPAEEAPIFTPPSDDIPIFTPPAEESSIFTPPSDDVPIFTPPAEEAPIFTPPSDDIPIFTPPAQNINGPVCFHHKGEPVAAQCARCGKYTCQDCADAYTVALGEYADQCLCYDCCKALVAENIELLKKQKTKISATFAFTIVGMLIGAILFADTGSVIGVIFGMLWLGSFWVWVKNSFSTWWNDPNGRSGAGFIGACIGGAIAAPYNTIVKIVRCIKYLTSTSKYIEEDEEALRQMAEYMEYTQVMNRNKGVNLETLMDQGGALHSNTYAQMVSSQGEDAADAMLRQYTTSIAENGEIIRNFAA